MNLYEKYGVFKCLGCPHYLSGDRHDCSKCQRTENGKEQIVCRIQNITKELKKLDVEKQRLIQHRIAISNLLADKEKVNFN
jgi:hypothetical protein